MSDESDVDYSAIIASIPEALIKQTAEWIAANGDEKIIVMGMSRLITVSVFRKAVELLNEKKRRNSVIDEIEVTPGMIEAGRKKWRSYLGGLGSKVEDDVWADVFRAMYAARSKPTRIFRAADVAPNAISYAEYSDDNGATWLPCSHPRYKEGLGE